MVRKARRPTANNNTPMDPLGPSEGALARGGGLAVGYQNHIERGTVILTDATRHTYRVALASGRTMVMNRIRSHPGDLTLLPHGTAVVVTFALGVPYIVGVLPPETAVPSEENAISVTDSVGHGGEDPALNRNLGVSGRAGGEPTDVLPGDFVGLGPDGASVSALHGKVAQLRASPLAKLQAFGDSDTVQIMAGLFRLITWMGEAKYVNDAGKVSYIWRGGSDQLTQTGADEEKYTLRLDLGASGNLAKFEVTTPEGQPVFRFHVSADGKCELFAAGGFNQHSGNSSGQTHPVRFHGSLEEEIEGQHSRRVSGNSTTQIESSRTESVSENAENTVGKDQTTRVGRDYRQTVGGDHQQIVAGNKRTDVTGNVRTVVGPGSLYEVNVRAGDLNLIASKIKAQSSAPDSVELGANPNFHVARSEPLEQVLLQIISDIAALKTLFTAHTHVLAGAAGPIPVVGNTTPPTTPATPIVVDTSQIKSVVVKVS